MFPHGRDAHPESTIVDCGSWYIQIQSKLCVEGRKPWMFTLAPSPVTASIGRVRNVIMCDDDLTERNLQRRAEVAIELPSYRSIKKWMKPIFTVAEKRCLCVNTKGRPPWVDKDEQHEPQPNAGLHPLEVMINAWCNYKAIIYCEVLSRYTALTVSAPAVTG
ncbi:hypothetical protein Y032_0075g923 [Ancylostoma ceylanicum]|uniref:Uncharacterized protein n=1 Tax=Ancylostoma ceylanicum TaxID=53326 RepID=A0A016TV27_9BILA|nr:hypothetical protein Y032_0075g923 [Ancylostoma ceylanicum]